MEKKIKTVITGLLADDKSVMRGESSFWYLNGDIELDADGDEVYIESQRKQVGSGFEDVSCKIRLMPQQVQDYINRFKRVIEVKE